MKTLMRALFLVLLGSFIVFASGGLNCGLNCDGEPPNGIGIDGSASGSKLSGVLSLEFYNFGLDPNPPFTPLADVRYILRLAKNTGTNTVTLTMFGQVFDVENPDNVTAVQQQISPSIAEQVLNNFFEGNMLLEVKVKSVTQFSGTQGAVTTALTGTDGSEFRVMDIVLAVQ